MRVLVVGYGKGFDSSDVAKAIAATGWNIDSLHILSKGVRGVDLSVSKFAEANNIPLRKFEANTETEGDLFRLLVRSSILECHCVLAFWDGDSKKTVTVVDSARASGKLIYIYEKEDGDENNL